MKLPMAGNGQSAVDRAPRGARGLKQYTIPNSEGEAWSRPARGAWIETISRHPNDDRRQVAPRAGRVD